MKKYIDKPVIENILHKLWKKDTGYENIDIARIAYNRALQDVQCEMDALEVQEETVSEDKMTISKEWFEHCKKSWYNEGYLAGEFNRGRQFEDSVSNDVKKAAEQDVCEVINTCSATGIPNDHIPSWVQDAMVNEFIHGAKWQLAKIKNITLDDLEKFINELSKQFPEVSFAKVCKIATRTAKWLLDVKLPQLEED